MLSTVIIDDEQHCIDRLNKLLSDHQSQTIHLIGICKTVEEAITFLQKHKVDIVFLDVEIHDKKGFDVLSALPSITFQTIFTTAHDKYAVQAFRVSAADFLLKPIDADELFSALEKCMLNKNRTDQNEKIQTLLSNLQPGNEKRITIPTITGFDFIRVNDIIRLQSDGNYTTLFLEGKRKLTVAKTLKDFDIMLSEFSFFRTHQSHLINLQKIRSYHKGKGGYVIMEDGAEVEVSTRKKEEFLVAMQRRS